MESDVQPLFYRAYDGDRRTDVIRAAANSSLAPMANDDQAQRASASLSADLAVLRRAPSDGRSTSSDAARAADLDAVETAAASEDEDDDGVPAPLAAENTAARDRLGAAMQQQLLADFFGSRVSRIQDVYLGFARDRLRDAEDRLSPNGPPDTNQLTSSANRLHRAVEDVWSGIE